MQDVRESLRASHLDLELIPSGAKIRVWPHQYQAAVDAAQQHQGALHPSHVVIIESLKPALDDDIMAMSRKSKVKVKKDGMPVVTRVPVLNTGPPTSSAMDAHLPLCCASLVKF